MSYRLLGSSFCITLQCVALHSKPAVTAAASATAAGAAKQHICKKIRLEYRTKAKGGCGG